MAMAQYPSVDGWYSYSLIISNLCASINALSSIDGKSFIYMKKMCRGLMATIRNDGCN